MSTPEEVEVGDLVRLTIGEGYNQATLEGRAWVGGLSVGNGHPLVGWTKVDSVCVTAIEILEKAEPEWHRAQVINAEVKGSKDPKYFIRLNDPVTCAWIDSEGVGFDHEDLENVVIIIGPDE